MLVVQRETFAFFLGKKMKFSTTVFIFGFRLMVALPMCGAL